MDVDDVLESKFTSKPVRTAKGLCRAPCEMVNVCRYPLREQRTEDRILQDLVIKDFLKAMNPLVTAGVPYIVSM